MPDQSKPPRDSLDADQWIPESTEGSDDAVDVIDEFDDDDDYWEELDEERRRATLQTAAEWAKDRSVTPDFAQLTEVQKGWCVPKGSSTSSKTATSWSFCTARVSF